ncbi:MAG: hypothetical protein LBC82_01100 [Oscillospiraceae bacterium]|nr:hypothetical protein [Oscillospiraceae bacterium]
MRKQAIVAVLILFVISLSASAVISEPRGSLAFYNYHDENAFYPNEEITIDAADYYYADDEVIIYRFIASEAGLYCLEAAYVSTPGYNGEIIFDMVLNGRRQDSPLSLSLFRYRRSGRALLDVRGNEVPPLSLEYGGMLTRTLKDGAKPIYFELEAGINWFTLSGVNRAGVTFISFAFKNYEKPPNYEEIRPSEEQINSTRALTTTNTVGGRAIFLQAERPSFMTDAGIAPSSENRSRHIIPSSPSVRLYNILGWSGEGRAASWEFGVPFDGYYRFSFKVRQNAQINASSYRRILLNGIVPCMELSAVEFKYNRDWYRQNLTDGGGEDIYIFLDAGRHVLTIEALHGELEFDYIEIATAHEQFVEFKETFYDRLVFGFSRLMNSYFEPAASELPSAGKTIDVWVGANREITALLQMIAYEFNSRYANVKINPVDGSVLEAALAGRPPDAALFIGSEEITMLGERGFLTDFPASNGAVLFKNMSDFYAEEAAREFLEWFASEDIQERFKQQVYAAGGFLHE